MSFPWTLQRYVFREMGKTCLLAAVGLTVSLSLGGGVLNMIKLGDVTPGQLLRLMTLVIPIAAALTLPVAVLFSAAATYGRLSADNEFVACRSSGVNLHILFLPALVLGLISASVTFACLNFVIPQIVRNLDNFLEADVITLLQRRLDQPRGIRLDREGRGLRVAADRAVLSPDDPNEVSLLGIAFMEVDQGRCLRYGTAQRVDLWFERSADRIRASGRMVNLSFFDLEAQRFAELSQQVVAARDLPALVPRKIKFLNLPQLLRYLVHPERWTAVTSAFERLRMFVARRMVYDWLADQWATHGKQITLPDPEGRYVVSSAQANRLARDAGIELKDARVEIEQGGAPQTCQAQRVVLEVSRGDSIEESGIQIDAYDARISSRQQSVSRPKATFGPAPLPAIVLQRVNSLGPAALLTFPAGDSGPLAEQQVKAGLERDTTIRDIMATLNERNAFSVSVLVLVVLGAALGIVFRGAQAVVAFGISFVPSLLVIVTIVMGKQMAHNAATHQAGLLVMWGGIVVVAFIDVWMLARVVRR